MPDSRDDGPDESVDLVPLNTQFVDVPGAIEKLKVNLESRNRGKFFTTPDEENAQLFFRTSAAGTNTPTYEPVMQLQLDSKGNPVKDDQGNLKVKPVIISYRQADSFSTAFEKAEDVRDTSLRVPAGVEGIVVDVKVLTRKGARAKTKEEQQEEHKQVTELRHKYAEQQTQIMLFIE